jgi:hypothetical protein
MPQAPFGDETVEMWGVSTVMAREDCERLDRAFELHPRRYWGDFRVMERLNSFDGPIYMQERFDEIPNSVRFPYEEVRREFFLPAMGDNLFVTNTITWMLLLALHEGYTDISLYGVHMAHESEYGYQQASCSWALGIIHGRMLEGKPYKLTIAEDSELLKARYEYGYGEPTRAMQYVEKRRQGLLKGIKEAGEQIDNLQRRKFMTEGAAQEAKIIYDHLAGFK